MTDLEPAVQAAYRAGLEAALAVCRKEAATKNETHVEYGSIEAPYAYAEAFSAEQCGDGIQELLDAAPIPPEPFVLEMDLARYREALTFYADERNLDAHGRFVRLNDQGLICPDEGYTAYRALEPDYNASWRDEPDGLPF